MPSILPLVLACWPVIAIVAVLVTLGVVLQALGLMDRPRKRRRRGRRHDDF